MTRAKKRLFLTYAQTRRKFGQLQQNTPSRFLFESGLVDENEVQETQPRFTDYRSKYGLYGGSSSGGYQGGNYERRSFYGRGDSRRSGDFEGYASKSKFQKQYDEYGYEIEPNQDLDYTESSSFRRASSYTMSQTPSYSLSDPRRVPGYKSPEPEVPAAPAEKNADGVAVGGLVKHGVFGQGKIVQIVGSGESAKITVLFGNGTRRTFMLKFAPLEIL